MRYLTVDGMLSGTGVRDAVDGGFVELADLDISTPLATDLTAWVRRFESAHYRQFSDAIEVADLESMGMALARRLKSELADAKVRYCSCATLVTTFID